MKDKNDDWRLSGQEAYLQGRTLFHREYKQYTKNLGWDHDHCAFCWAKFSLYDDPEHLKEGYTTEDNYHWVCPTCLKDFGQMFQWTVVEDETKQPESNK